MRANGKIEEKKENLNRYIALCHNPFHKIEIDFDLYLQNIQ